MGAVWCGHPLNGQTLRCRISLTGSPLMTFIHLITSFIYVDTQWYYSAQAKVCQAEKILYEPLCLLFIAGAQNDVPPNVCQ